ncbi:hypothetical protein [Falsigemmobacter faecalis]|uniref:Uncharacterized protein n=1 Tax=Falsigemmobacter faecalis TaxID=2488730 RepID=A0A3P3DNI6_9RHOB|nr:hypothetical protein [Falsigemmobacter faecalis]RRH75809.1 hypothetical protein EG244_07735 [Falsigemmobacter faecalis]
MAKLPSDKKRSGRRSGLDRLERLQPHVHGTDWRKKPGYTKWRFNWRLPLFGGRLPAPSWFAARLHEIYRFFLPYALGGIAALIGWYLWQGQRVSVWLWIALTPLIFEIPRMIVLAGGVKQSLKDGLSLLLQILAAPIYLLIMLIVKMRMK